MELLEEAKGNAAAQRLLELLLALPVAKEQVQELANAIAAYAGDACTSIWCNSQMAVAPHYNIPSEILQCGLCRKQKTYRAKHQRHTAATC